VRVALKSVIFLAAGRGERRGDTFSRRCLFSRFCQMKVLEFEKKKEGRISIANPMIVLI